MRKQPIVKTKLIGMEGADSLGKRVPVVEMNGHIFTPTKKLNGSYLFLELTMP